MLILVDLSAEPILSITGRPPAAGGTPWTGELKVLDHPLHILNPSFLFVNNVLKLIDFCPGLVSGVF